MNQKDEKNYLALITSAIFTPPLVAAAAILGVTFHYTPHLTIDWLWGIFGIILLFGPASLFILYSYKFGKVNDLTLSDRSDRLSPLLLSLMGTVIGTWILLVRHAPEGLIVLGIILICELVALVLITSFWKISIHMLTLATAVTALVYLLDRQMAYLYILLVPVAWARVYRKRHTELQVILGAVVGVGIALAVFHLFNYIPR